MLDFAEARWHSLKKYLVAEVSGEVRFDDTSRKLYSTDASHYQIEPRGVVVPKSASDIVATVQIAGELGIPITARGAGTSLSGQAIGPGIIIDCSKHYNQLLAVDPQRKLARLQPGIVLDQLNRHLAVQGLMFGPDVATINRATLGGMIGNNSAGARSVMFGQTVEHLRGLQVVLADGKEASVGILQPREYQRKLELRTLEGDAYRCVDRLITEHAAEIDRRYPKIRRKVSGYNLAGVLEARRKRAESLLPLIAGSEGTLACLTEIEVSLVPKPNCRGLLVPHFTDMRLALDAVGLCLEAGPSAVELMDKTLIDLARGQRGLSQTMASIEGEPAALLMVEFFGDTEAEVADKVEKLSRRLQGTPGLTAAVPALSSELRDPLWNLRSAAVPLLYGKPDKRKPISFVEDCAVDPAKMPEFATRFRELMIRHGTDGAFYGHASVGCLHIRPVLDLRNHADLKMMRAIMQDVTDLVLEFNGSLSGEHGDGLVRSEWNEKMFGPSLYKAFQEIKSTFDPANVLNPGKIVNALPIEQNLREHQEPVGGVQVPKTVFDYTKQGGFFRSIELCNGAGVCRKTQGGTMCPSYRATKDEKESTRGRANALRIALSTTEPHSRENPLANRWLADVMDLCLSCKACKTECPSNVDMAKLKGEFLQAFYAHRPRPLGHLLVKNVDWLFPLGARFARVGNWLSRRGFVRGLLEGMAGIDRRRSLPELHENHFRRWFAERQPSVTPTDPGKRVILLDDCFTTYQEPNIGKSAVQLLEMAGYRVELAGVCCGRAMISKGFLTAAQLMAAKGVRRLKAAAAQGVPILGLEPSCILTLSDEWTELVPGSDSQRVAERAELVESWVARQAADSDLPIRFRQLEKPMVLHGHCHQKALVGVNGTANSLRLIPDAELQVLDAGCCGMAGSFGYEKSHFDISVKIAELALLPGLKSAGNAEVIATGTSCRHQIHDLAGRTALHPVELLARQAEPTSCQETNA